MAGIPDRLVEAGIRSVGEVARTTEGDLRALPRMGKASVRRLRDQVSALARLDRSRLPAYVRGPRRLLPRVPTEVLERLFGATTVREEVEALAERLSPRNATVFLQRLCRGHHAHPSLKELGSVWNISGERARQIVEDREKVLEASGLRLPLCSRLIALLDRERGLADTPGLLRLARTDGLDLDEGVLPALPRLSELGLVPPLRYLPDLDFWIARRGRLEWVRSGALSRCVTRVKELARESFRKISCVEESFLVNSSPPLTPRQVARVLGSPERDVERVSGYLVPAPILPSTLTRLVEKMLAVSMDLPLAEVVDGLDHVGSRIPISVPPAPVLRYVLEHHPACRVLNGRIRASTPSAVDGILSAGEEALVSILDRAGGAVEFGRIAEDLEARGFSKHTPGVLLGRTPVVRRLYPGIYSLRGRGHA